MVVLVRLRGAWEYLRSYPLSIAYLIVAVALIYVYWQVLTLSRETNTIVKQELVEKNLTIQDQQAVINQAVAAIQQLGRQIERLGGDPPNIVLSPPPRPKEENP